MPTKITALTATLFCAIAATSLCGAQEQAWSKPEAGRYLQFGGGQAVRNQQRVPAVMRNPDHDPSEPTNPNRTTGSRLTYTESMRESVNPCGRNYGDVFDTWQEAIVQSTIASWSWWAGVVCFFALVFVLFILWWLYERGEIQQECFGRAAAVLIGERNTAYSMARNAVTKHNQLVDRYDNLCERSAGLNSSGASQAIELPGAASAAPAAAAASSGKAPLKTITPEDSDGEPEITPQGEPVVTADGVKYISLVHHQARVRALEAKVTAQKTTINTLRQTVLEMRNKLEKYEGSPS